MSESADLGVDVLVKLQRDASLYDTRDKGHNRWHPEVPPLAEIDVDQVVEADVRDGFDEQLDETSNDVSVAAMDLKRGHPLTGPFFVRGAEPGDVLEVEILDVQPDPVGTTCIIPGLGLLGDEFDSAFLVVWNIENGIARSDRLPGIAIRGEPFVGLIGVAPSQERLREFARRELDLSKRGGLVLLPDPESAVPSEGPAATHGLRTIPPRETGGNMDIKQARPGARVLLGVDVPGGLLSVGDIHFGQGDGESCGVAIEVSGVIRFRTRLCKARDAKWKPRFPALEYLEPAVARERAWIATTGIPVDTNGLNGYFDVYEAARNALRELVEFLVRERGLSFQQAYVLVSVAADLRISSIVNTPNAVVSAILPLDVFET
jgi:formamidase